MQWVPVCYGLGQYVFAKAHASKKQDDKPSGRTLFVAGASGLPDSVLEEIFGAFGETDGVVRERVASGTQGADEFVYVILKKEKVVKEIVKDSSMKTSSAMPSSKSFLKQCIAQYASMHKDPAEIEAASARALEEFDRREEQERLERQNSLMTADGFTLVEPRRKMKRGDEDEGEQPKKKKTEGLTDFYRFQVREGKRQEIATLRKQFEEDKEKIAKMKAQRKFRPI